MLTQVALHDSGTCAAVERGRSLGWRNPGREPETEDANAVRFRSKLLPALHLEFRVGPCNRLAQGLQPEVLVRGVTHPVPWRNLGSPANKRWAPADDGERPTRGEG